MEKLGNTEISLGNFTRSRKLLKKALTMQKKEYGINHIKTSFTLRSMGRLELELRNYNQSKPLLEQALVIQRQWYEKNHPEISITCNLIDRLILEQWCSKIITFPFDNRDFSTITFNYFQSHQAS